LFAFRKKELTNDPEDSASCAREEEEDQRGTTVGSVHGRGANNGAADSDGLATLAGDQVEATKDKSDGEQEERASDTITKSKCLESMTDL
jgi:hypothetical protein